jgi:hypothetical protein
MKTTWRHFYRRIASVVFVGAATAWSSAASYAVQLAFDSASDPVYNDGWQGAVTNITPNMGPGDNGGFGFTPWSFNNDIYNVPVIGIRSMDGPPTAQEPGRTQSPFNQVNTAWRLGLKYNETGETSWKDIVNVGRGLASPLEVGQTLSVVIDPPSDNQFFDIETIRFNTGGDNQCPGCSEDVSERFQLRMFNWTEPQYDYGRWDVNDVSTPLFFEDKAPGQHPEFPQGAAGTNQGMRIDFTLTGPEMFALTLTPLDNPAAAHMTTGALTNPGTGSIDWIEFEHYGRPTPEPDKNAFDTDFFIRSLEITGDAPSQTADFDNDGDVDGADFLTWQRGVGKTSPTLADGDADDDNDVDADDLTVWKQQFGGAAGAAALTAAVPEPASLSSAAIALGGLATMALARRKRWSSTKPVAER